MNADDTGKLLVYSVGLLAAAISLIAVWRKERAAHDKLKIMVELVQLLPAASATKIRGMQHLETRLGILIEEEETSRDRGVIAFGLVTSLLALSLVGLNVYMSLSLSWNVVPKIVLALGPLAICLGYFYFILPQIWRAMKGKKNQKFTYEQ